MGKRGMKNRIIIGITGVAVVIVAAITIACCSQSNQPPAQQPEGRQPEYLGLQEKWNQYARDYPAYMLIGDRGGTDENIIKALNGWLAVFAEKPGKEYLSQLDKLEQEYGKTAFHAWEEYRKEHYRANPLKLPADMPQGKVAETINSYIGVSQRGQTPDYITPDTVRTIVYMHDLCAFFAGKKQDLHKKLIDTKLDQCQQLSTNGDFPALDSLIK